MLFTVSLGVHWADAYAFTLNFMENRNEVAWEIKLFFTPFVMHLNFEYPRSREIKVRENQHCFALRKQRIYLLFIGLQFSPQRFLLDVSKGIFC